MSWGFLRSKEGDRSEFSHLTSYYRYWETGSHRTWLVADWLWSPSKHPVLLLSLSSSWAFGLKRAMIRRHSDGLFPSDLLTWCYIAIADSWSDDLRHSNHERNGENEAIVIQWRQMISADPQRGIKSEEQMLAQCYCTEHACSCSGTEHHLMLFSSSVRYMMSFVWILKTFAECCSQETCMFQNIYRVYIHTLMKHDSAKKIQFLTFSQHVVIVMGRKRSRRLLVTRS